MPYSIYEGIWTDWTMGRWKGTTITLSQGDGALLLAFIATFIALVSMRLWRIISFTLHQIHATPRAHDGLHFQRQHTLRNTTSPAAAAKTFLLQLWYWRKTKQVALRTLPWALFALLYIAVFAVLAVFSSRVSSGASPSRLILPRDCGSWKITDTLPMTDKMLINIEKTAYDVMNAVGTARSCYSSNATSLACNTAPVPMLESDANQVACPFGDDICLDGKAFEVKTRSIDSRLHLGINARPEDGIMYDRQLTCAPLVSKGYGQMINNTNDASPRVQYFYGSGDHNTSNYTYEYLLQRFSADVSYQVNIWEHRLSNASLWSPIPALSRTGADTFIIFVEQNSVLHRKANRDPVFGATTRANTVSDVPMFRSDRYVSPIACFQQHRFCHPSASTQCSPWSGRYELLSTLSSSPSSQGFNTRQIATASRIFLASLSTSIYETINARSSKCLRAQDKMEWLFQMPLPDNQWELEVLAWAQEGLAALQAAVQEYVAGPTIELEGAYMLKMYREDNDMPRGYSQEDRDKDHAWRDMCANQIVRDTQGTLNFSVLGIAVIFVLGVFITVLSFVVEPLTAVVQKMLNIGVERANAWQRDDGLQMLRMLFEAHGRGNWTGAGNMVPITSEKGEVFFFPEEGVASGVVREVYHSLPNKVEHGSC
jgi:hypothetical protein